MHMPANRPAVPRKLDRRLRVEAGHRCAIPTCRVPILEIAHIQRWEEVRQHEFENMIALCPNCHTLFDRGHIDRLSMLQYKANLSPFSPYALAAHPEHIDFLATYQKFRAFIQMWLAGALAFRAAKQQGSSSSELRRRFEAVGQAAEEAGYALLCLGAVSPANVSKLADQILDAAMRSSCKTMDGETPAAFLPTGPASDDIPAMWADLDHKIHEVINKPAPKTLKVMPRRPILLEDLVDKGGHGEG